MYYIRVDLGTLPKSLKNIPCDIKHHIMQHIALSLNCNYLILSKHVGLGFSACRGWFWKLSRSRSCQKSTQIKIQGHRFVVTWFLILKLSRQIETPRPTFMPPPIRDKLWVITHVPGLKSRGGGSKGIDVDG
jgi:hypothetical protein